MDNRPVINASPLIYLSRAKLISLLQILSPEVLVPQSVAEEIEHRDSSDPAVQSLMHTRWLIVVDNPLIHPFILSWDLGLGESSVLAWAYTHSGTEAIIDDLAARRCARSLNIFVRGTLGLVLVAKKRGEIKSARSLLETLRQSGMYLSDRIMNQALLEVNE